MCKFSSLPNFRMVGKNEALSPQMNRFCQRVCFVTGIPFIVPQARLRLIWANHPILSFVYFSNYKFSSMGGAIYKDNPAIKYEEHNIYLNSIQTLGR